MTELDVWLTGWRKWQAVMHVGNVAYQLISSLTLKLQEHVQLAKCADHSGTLNLA